MWTFRKIELGDVSEVLVYKQAMLESKSTMDGTNGLHVHSHPKTYIRLCIDNEQGKQIPSHLVKNTQFVCVDENNHIIGMCNVRHELNELLFNLAGHIGYSVHPSYRRQGVATFMLGEALKYCGVHSGREGDKFKASGLTLVAKHGIRYPDEANLVLLCQKLAAVPITEDTFTAPDIKEKWYKDGDYHTMYVAEIIEVLSR
jgi:predicted acetyltransferase